MANLLFLSQRIPYPPNKGDKIRALKIFEHLRQWYDIHLGCLVDDPADWEQRGTLAAMCADSHFARLDRGRAKLTCLRGLLTGTALSVEFFRDAALAAWIARVRDEVKPDAIFVYSSNMAPYILDRRDPGQLRIVDLVDVDFGEMARLRRNRARADALDLPARMAADLGAGTAHRRGMRRRHLRLRRRGPAVRQTRARSRRQDPCDQQRRGPGLLRSGPDLSGSFRHGSGGSGAGRFRFHRNDGLRAEHRCRRLVRAGHPAGDPPHAARRAVPYRRPQPDRRREAPGRHAGRVRHRAGGRRAALYRPRHRGGRADAHRAGDPEQGAGSDGHGAPGGGDNRCPGRGGSTAGDRSAAGR